MKVLLLIALFGMFYFAEGISTCSFRSFACKLTCKVGKLFNKDCRKCDCESKPRCPPLCKRHCPNGHVIDSNGCATCQCKSPVKRCPPVCPINCPNGKVLDRTGCPICQCKPVRPLFPKPNVICPTRVYIKKEPDRCHNKITRNHVESTLKNEERSLMQCAAAVKENCWNSCNKVGNDYSSSGKNCVIV